VDAVANYGINHSINIIECTSVRWGVSCLHPHSGYFTLGMISVLVLFICSHFSFSTTKILVSYCV
jgi:hypothetical protein